MNANLPLALQLIWFAATVLFVAGLRHLSSPGKARQGIRMAAVGMLLAIGSMFFHPNMQSNLLIMICAMLAGGMLAGLHAYRVDMSRMPQMIALYNSLGGIAAAGVGMEVLLNVNHYAGIPRVLAVPGSLIGFIAFAGSFLAFLRMRGHLPGHAGFARQQVAYLSNGALVLLLGLVLAASQTAHPILLVLFAALAISFGVLMTLPAAIDDMPVLVSFYNALTGLAVAFDGFVLNNPAMVVAGVIVFSAGSLLTRLMARAVNRRLSEIMYSGFSLLPDTPVGASRRSYIHAIDVRDAAVDMAYARRVEIVPGYGMATSQAQHKLRELTQLLDERGVETGFSIHPVAGRMPGHMNVLLAEAGVPYDRIHDLADINAEFSQVDIALVIGANDIVNTSARDDPKSPLYGMPLLDVGQAKRVIVIKRSDNVGYAGVDNPLWSAPVTRVLFGDARNTIQQLILNLKRLD